MPSLSAHLREPGDHGRLRFHPICPLCRDQRLAGALPSDGIVSRRAQALVAAGALALSSAAPASVLAATGGDEEAPGEQIAAGDPALDPDAIGGDDEAIPDDPDPVPVAAPGTEASGPDSGEVEDPASEDDADAVDQSSNSTSASPSTRDVSQAEPASPPASPPGASPAAAGPGAAQPAATSPAPSPGVAASAVRDQRGRLVVDARVRHGAEVRALVSRARSGARVVRSGRVVQAVQAVQAGGQAGATQTDVAQPVVAKAVVPARSGRRAAPGDRVHVVLGGESLWSIAGDVLGGRATVAQVAREVNRLWELNRARIGTGDRDLLPVGTRLVLQ
jgi:hypothetical protein